MHITITGNLGSGKSTICKILEDKYGFEIYSTGKVQRQIAKEMNISTLEMNQLMMSDPKYDTMIDDATAKISRENRDKNIIFDSRLAWHFVEQSFKVFISVSLDVAAERVMNDNRGQVEKYSSIEEAKALLSARAETENKRYRMMYNLDYFNFDNYDLIIDSTYTSPEIVASIIMQEAKIFDEAIKTSETMVSNQSLSKILFTPARLYPYEISIDDQTRCEHMAEQLKNTRDYTEELVLVEQKGLEYLIKEGKDIVLASRLAKVPFVLISLKN